MNLKKIEESFQSFEILIDSINKAEGCVKERDDNIKSISPSPFLIPKKYNKDNINVLIGINKSNKIEAKKGIIPSVKQKAPAYNFHINLTNVNEKSKLKSNNNQIKSGNIIVNHVDDIQKLKLKVNAGLINSARSTIENEINSARSNSSLKQQIINKNIESIKKNCWF